MFYLKIIEKKTYDFLFIIFYFYKNLVKIIRILKHRRTLMNRKENIQEQLK